MCVCRDAAKFFAAASELCQQCDLPLFAKGEEIKALKKQEQLARKRHNKTLSHPGTGQDVEEWRELGLPRLRTRARAACWAAGIPRARSLDVQVKFHFPGFDATDGLIALMKEADAAWQQKSLPDLQRRAAELTIEGTGGKPDRHIGVSALLLEQATDSRSFADQGATVVKLIENAMSADEAMQVRAATQMVLLWHVNLKTLPVVLRHPHSMWQPTSPCRRNCCAKSCPNLKYVHKLATSLWIRSKAQTKIRSSSSS